MNETTAQHGAKATGLRVLTLDPRTYDRALGCVHCGLCLPACPTYTTTGNEADSPRGRIQIMKGLADGTVQYDAEAKEHLDLCLDCRACETACPSEVVYHELIEETRTRLAGVVPAGAVKGADTPPLLRWFFFHVLTHPGRLRLSLLPVRLLQRVGVYGLLRRVGVVGLGMKALGGSGRAFGKLEAMLPEGAVWPRAPEGVTKPSGGVARKMRVAYFGTCVGSVMFEGVNRKAVELLAACGAEVVYPPHGDSTGGQVCCGAIHHHNADEHGATALARRNIDTLLATGAERIVCAVAGCGAQLREYALLLRDDAEYAGKAAEVVGRVRDVSEVVLELGLPADLREVRAVATYHDACHLVHGQGVSAAPRKLLAMVPGLRMVALRESDMCCGAAGTYNLTQPEMAASLGHRKLGHIAGTGAEIVVSGNAGCTLHISGTAKAAGKPVRVMHPVEVLHASVFGDK